MNSSGTPPIVQKNRSAPGKPVSNIVTSFGERARLLHRAPEVVGHERQRSKALGRDVPQVLRNIEHLDQAGIACAEHGDVRAVGRRPAQRLLEYFTGHAQFELNLHPDDIRQEGDECLRRMAAHDHMM